MEGRLVLDEKIRQFARRNQALRPLAGTLARCQKIW
jgi:hypothetical protein